MQLLPEAFPLTGQWGVVGQWEGRGGLAVGRAFPGVN